MSSITFEILIVVLLIIANGVFAMSEIAVVSARKIRLQDLADRGDTKAQAALELANSPNRFLSTVQVGITLIGIFAGAFGGATIAGSLSVYLDRIPLIQPYSQPLAFFLVVLGTTYLSLIVGELVPKRLALNDPEKIAIATAVPMRWLATIAYPIVHLLSVSTESVLKLLGVNPATTEPLVTEDEIKVLIRQGTEAGMFEEAEQDMVERVFHLGDQRATALMTPRFDITWLDINDTFEVNRQKMISSRHSRFPICQDALDHVLGVAHVTDILSRSLSGEAIDFTTILRQPLYVPESTRALKILELFQQSGSHIAIVVDEYGVIQGIITLNDVMEVIIGDIPFADQPHEADVIRREDGSLLIDGMLPIDELKKWLEVEDLPGEERGIYHTLGGFVVAQLGRIPASSDHFEWADFRFEVVDMDGNRVDKVLVISQLSPTSDT
jgi:putative hemolysin